MWIYAIIVMGAGFLSFKFNILSFKSYRIESIETRYDVKINEKRLCQLEGIYLMIMGGVVLIVSSFNESWNSVLLCCGLFIILGISYYPIRARMLKLNNSKEG